MNDSIKDVTAIFDDSQFTEFFEAYIDCALWSSAREPEDGSKEITDENDADDIDSKTLLYLACVAFKFYEENRCYILAEENPPSCDDGSGPFARAGHDFWLTSAGHGAGFWDGDWKTYGELLTKRSKASGEVNLIMGDSGKIFH